MVLPQKAHYVVHQLCSPLLIGDERREASRALVPAADSKQRLQLLVVSLQTRELRVPTCTHTKINYVLYILPDFCFQFHKTLYRYLLSKFIVVCVTSGFCRGVDQNCALLRCYPESNGNSLPTFRDNLSVPFQGSRRPINYNNNNNNNNNNVGIIPGKHKVKELQKTSILGTAHILRKVLM